METARFDYRLPVATIAQSPADPRDAARLLDTRDASDHLVADLPRLLRPGDLLVVNEARVRRARLEGRKSESGGKVEALLLEDLREGRWRALVRPARRLRPGARLEFESVRAEVTTEPIAGETILRFDGDIEDRLPVIGELALPPYFHGRLDDPDRYQTMFAADPIAVAAPTAGLHFTPGLVERLLDAGVGIARIRLAVGQATFRPIATADIEDHDMHSEWFEVGAEAVAAVESAKESGGRVVAVGTTVVRALESSAAAGSLVASGGRSDLYISPGYEFRVVDLLLTNFHMPRSSLLVLVEAFMGPSWRRAYRLALERGYRFLSFGDAMLAERAG